jgi:hypothetical protein
MQTKGFKKSGSPVNNGKEPEHEGHEVHKGENGTYFMNDLPSWPLCTLCLKMVFPLLCCKDVRSAFALTPCPSPKVGRGDGERAKKGFCNRLNHVFATKHFPIKNGRAKKPLGSVSSSDILLKIIPTKRVRP